MKKLSMLLAAVALTSLTALAQEPAKTEVTVRDNGTVKTETRTGRTRAGQAVHNTGQDVKYAGKKTGHAIEKGAKKTGHAVKKGAQKVGDKAKDVVD